MGNTASIQPGSLSLTATMKGNFDKHPYKNPWKSFYYLYRRSWRDPAAILLQIKNLLWILFQVFVMWNAGRSCNLLQLKGGENMRHLTLKCVLHGYCYICFPFLRFWRYNKVYLWGVSFVGNPQGPLTGFNSARVTKKNPAGNPTPSIGGGGFGQKME